jgi:hypothetical protein
MYFNLGKFVIFDLLFLLIKHYIANRFKWKRWRITVLKSKLKLTIAAKDLIGNLIIIILLKTGLKLLIVGYFANWLIRLELLLLRTAFCFFFFTTKWANWALLDYIWVDFQFAPHVLINGLVLWLYLLIFKV